MDAKTFALIFNGNNTNTKNPAFFKGKMKELIDKAKTREENQSEEAQAALSKSYFLTKPQIAWNECFFKPLKDKLDPMIKNGLNKIKAEDLSTATFRTAVDRKKGEIKSKYDFSSPMSLFERLTSNPIKTSEFASKCFELGSDAYDNVVEKFGEAEVGDLLPDQGAIKTELQRMTDDLYVVRFTADGKCSRPWKTLMETAASDDGWKMDDNGNTVVDAMIVDFLKGFCEMFGVSRNFD